MHLASPKVQYHPDPEAPVVSPDSVFQVSPQRLCSHAASFTQTVQRLAHGWEGPQAW